MNKDNCVVLMIDIQEKLVKATDADIEAKNAYKILKTANLMNIPVIVTEQYPKGLGETVSELKSVFNENTFLYEKTDFSALNNEDVLKKLQTFGKKQVVLFGIEAHICVLQTAKALIQNGYEVFLIKDASKSRKNFEFETGINLMQQYGVKISCCEILLFDLLKSSKNPNFKEVQALIK